MARRTSLASPWLCLAASLALGCDRESPAPPKTTAASASAAPSASAPPVQSSRLPTRHPDIACRAVRASGEIHELESRRVVRSGSPLDGRAWVELGKDAKLALRHARSARELLVTGPALLLPCVHGEEQVLLAEGRLETTSGPGARPGAEVTVASPLGSVRYADATLEIRASGRRLVVSSRAGTAEVEAAPGTKLQGKPRLEPKQKLTVVGEPKPERLVEACEKAATEAGNRAQEVLAGGDAGKSLGERAAAHVQARQAARGICSVASAAAATAKEPERARLLARVAAADGRWRAVPHPKKPGGG